VQTCAIAGERGLQSESAITQAALIAVVFPVISAVSGIWTLLWAACNGQGMGDWKSSFVEGLSAGLSGEGGILRVQGTSHSCFLLLL
jgi:hypothetical protein